jgi:hypothetical protein
LEVLLAPDFDPHQTSRWAATEECAAQSRVMIARIHRKISRDLCLNRSDFFLRSLIRIKDRIRQFGILPRNPREVAMPVDPIVVSAAVVSVFAVFSAVLIWGDFLSQPIQQETVSRNKRRHSF